VTVNFSRSALCSQLTVFPVARSDLLECNTCSFWACLNQQNEMMSKSPEIQFKCAGYNQIRSPIRRVGRRSRVVTRPGLRVMSLHSSVHVKDVLTTADPVDRFLTYSVVQDIL
jgi:hypothetical protein